MFIKAIAIAALFPMLAALGPTTAPETTVADTSTERVGDPYPLNTCPSTGDAFEEGKAPVVKIYDGREVKFCCSPCIKDFEADLEASMAKLDQEIIETQRKHYPITTCIIGKGPLGDMGDPVEIVYQNRLVRFCCAGCLPEFNSDPAAALAELDKVIIEQQLDAYPFDKCLISNESFATEVENPINFVVANRLFRVCCNHCVDEITNNPHEYIAQLDAAYADAQRADYPLNTCPVSGEELGGMGDPYEIVAGNTLIRLCCKGCVDEINANPMKYTAMVKAARE